MRNFLSHNYANRLADVGDTIKLTAASADYTVATINTTSNQATVSGFEFWRAGNANTGDWWNTTAIGISSGVFATPVTAEWQFNYPHLFTRILLRPYSTALTNSPKIWTVDGSNDGTTWTTLRSLDTSFATYTDYTYTFSGVGKFLRYRIRATSANRSDSGTSFVIERLWLLP